LFSKRAVASRHDLVDQVVIEIKSHAQAEGHTRPHAGGVRAYRLLEPGADFGKLFDITHFLTHFLADESVDTANELDVVARTQATLKPAGLPDGPGNAFVGPDHPGIRSIYSR